MDERYLGYPQFRQRVDTAMPSVLNEHEGLEQLLLVGQKLSRQCKNKR